MNAGIAAAERQSRTMFVGSLTRDGVPVITLRSGSVNKTYEILGP